MAAEKSDVCLKQAVLAGNVPLVTELLLENPDIRIVDPSWSTIFHVAVHANQAAVLRLLLEHNKTTAPVAVDVDATSNFTALYQAVGYNFVNCTTILLDYGADPNFRCSENNTPLHEAAIEDSIEAAQILVSRGADVMIKNKWGHTAAEIYRGSKDSEMYNILLGAGGSTTKACRRQE